MVCRAANAHTLCAVVAIQRFGSRMNLHIYFHAVIPAAVWALRDALVVIDLQSTIDDDIDDIVGDICHRVTTYIDRRTNDGSRAAKAIDNPDSPHRRRTRRRWWQRLRRVFAVDLLRCPCRAEMDLKRIGVLSRAQMSDALDSISSATAS